MKFILNESLSEKDIRKAMSKVYQAYEKYNEDDSNQNCMMCAWALEMQLRGNRSFLPRPVYSPRDVVFTEIDGGWLIVKKPRKIGIKKKLSVIQEVEEADEGARFYCHVNWQDSTGGHEFLVLNIDGKAYVADAQANVLNLVEDDHTYFEDINWDNSLLVRLDNKEIDDNILKYNDDKYIIEWDDELDPAFLEGEKEVTESLEKITYKSVSDIEQFKTYADQILGGDGNMSAADIQSSIKEIYIDNELVGYIGFSEYEEDDVKMLGIGNFMTIQQGKGHGTKIINDIVETKKNEYDLIYCFVDADNAGAIRLYKKLGTVYDEDGPNDNGQYYVTFYDNGKFELNEDYDPPYNEEQIKASYGDETYQRLIDDPAHAWRMKTGLELIHKEPTKKELERIWANWQEMTDEQKAESDKKSIKLFGKTNAENYNELIKLYESSEKDVTERLSTDTENLNLVSIQKFIESCDLATTTPPKKGGCYITPSGLYINTSDIKLKNKKLARDFDGEHEGLAYYLQEKGIISPYTAELFSAEAVPYLLNYIRCRNDGVDFTYLRLPPEALTQKQLRALESWLETCPYDYNLEVEDASGIQFRCYDFQEYSIEDIMRKVRRYYINRKLEESNQKFTLNESDTNEPKLYCISQEDLDGQTLEPRVPDNFFTKNGYEDGETPRVCFAPTIEQCLMGLSQNLKEKEFYVFNPEEVPEENIYKPTVEEVPDSEITDEIWITCPVKLKKVGKIKVLGDSGLDGHPFNYGDKTAELYDWDWEWLD